MDERENRILSSQRGTHWVRRCEAFRARTPENHPPRGCARLHTVHPVPKLFEAFPRDFAHRLSPGGFSAAAMDPLFLFTLSVKARCDEH